MSNVKDQTVVAKEEAAQKVAATPVVAPDPVPVEETKGKVLKIVNPHLTIEIEIPGLEVYKRTGLRNTVMKTGRGRIRTCGLSITLEGVEITDIPNGGDTVEVEGGDTVKADLKRIVFSPGCVIASGRTVIVPKPKAQKPKVKADAKDKAPKADAKADAKDKAPKADAKADAQADAKAVPSDW